MPTGSHHEVSMEMLRSDRSQASMSSPSGDPWLWGAPPGPSALSSSIAWVAPLALVANALVPLMTQPPAVAVTELPNRAGAPGLGALGSPLHPTQISPRSITPLNQRCFCCGVPSASISTRVLVWPSQHRASDRSALAISLVIIHSGNVLPRW